MNIWNTLSDPKYDTVFAIVKTIAAFVTFVAGVIGIYSGQTLRDSRLTRLGGVLIALLLVGTSLSIVIQLRQDDAQQIAFQQQRANFGKEQAAIDKEQVGIVALRNASHDLARSAAYASAVQTFDALIADYKEHCQPQSNGSTIYRDTDFNFVGGQLASVEALKHSDALPTYDKLDQWFGAVQLDISFYSSKAQGRGTLGKSDLDLQVQAVPEVNEQPQSSVTYWPSRHTFSLYQYAAAPKFTPANGTIGGVDDLEGTRMVAQISRPPTVARKFSDPPSLGEFAFFVSGRRFVFNTWETRPSIVAPQYDVTMPGDPVSFTECSRRARPTNRRRSARRPALASANNPSEMFPTRLLRFRAADRATTIGTPLG